MITLWDVFFCATHLLVCFFLFQVSRKVDRIEEAARAKPRRRSVADMMRDAGLTPPADLQKRERINRETGKRIAEEPQADEGLEENNGDICDNCGKSYVVIYRVPNETWAKIAPDPATLGKHLEHQYGGLLCVDCANDRAFRLGVRLMFVAEAFCRPVSDTSHADGNGCDTVSTTAPQMRVLSFEERVTMACPYPPEEGYKFEDLQGETCDVCSAPYPCPAIEENDSGMCGTCEMDDDLQRSMDRDKGDS